jgi:hypothetical protein
MRLKYLSARSAGACLVCILIVIQSLHSGEHLAVRLEREVSLKGPSVK